MYLTDCCWFLICCMLWIRTRIRNLAGHIRNTYFYFALFFIHSCLNRTETFRISFLIIINPRIPIPNKYMVLDPEHFLFDVEVHKNQLDFLAVYIWFLFILGDQLLLYSAQGIRRESWGWHRLRSGPCCLYNLFIDFSKIVLSVCAVIKRIS